MATIKGIKAGTTTITATYGGVTSNSVSFTVNAINATLTFTAVSGTLLYTGSNQKIGTITYTGDSSNVYYLVKTNNTTPAANDSGWTKIQTWTSTNPSTSTNTLDINSSSATGAVATYYVFLKADAGTNYNAVSVKAGGSKAIGKRQVKITAPTIVSSTLTYNKTNQNLTTGGASFDANHTSTSVGTMYYYASTSSTTPTFSTSTWTTSAAKAMDAGTYNIWYYCKVDDTANNTTASSGSATSINTVTQLSGTKVINKKTVSLTWGTTTWTYDGSSHSTTCTAGSLESGDTCTVTLSGNSVGPNVGTATVTASSLSNANYQLPSSKTATLTITAKEVAIEWGTASWTYNGSAHSTSCTVKSTSLVSGDTCTVTLSGNSITYVGSTTVTATGLSNTNYKLPTSGLTKTITVTKANPTITVTGVNTTYTGSAIYAKLTGTNIKGTIYWKSGSAPTVSSYGGKQDVTSTGTNLSVNLGSITNNADDYTLYWLFVPSSTANSLSSGHTYAENYNEASNTVAMTINAAAITIPTITAVEVTYDKAAHSLSFPAVTGASITKYETSTNGSTWTVADPATTNPSLTNAGTLYVRAYYTADANHSGSGYTTGKTIKINQKEVTLTWGTASWTYDGSTHSTTCTAGSLESGDTCTVTLTGNSVGKNVGSATVTASSLSNANYKLPSSKTKTISITQRQVTLTWGTLTWPYDGSAHSTTCTAGNLVSGDTCTVTLTGNSITNVGTTTVTASALSNDNYKLPSTKTATLTIESGTLTVTATPYSGTYDGASHNGITAISATNQNGTSVSPTFTYCTTETGTYSSTIPTVKDKTTGTKIYYKATLTGYTTATGYVNAVVTAKTATLSWGTHTWTYDAASHTVTCSVSNLESGDSCTVTLSSASRTNQGSQTVTATALSNSNYALPSSKTTTLTINKRPVKITAASDSKTYDGTALTNTGYSGEAAGTNRGLVSGHSVTSCTVTGSQTVVGSSNNVPSSAVIKSGSTDVTANYDITYVNGTLTVSARAVNVTAPGWVSGTITYNGNNQTLATGGSCTTGGTMYYYISTTNSTPTFNASTWSTSQDIQAKDAGTYHVWYYCKVDDTTNNSGSSINTVTKLSNSKEIGKKTVSLSWGTLSWMYDGAAHSTTCTAGSLCTGDSCTVNLTGNSITNKGTTTVTASSLSNNNYQLPSSKTNTLEITARTVTYTADNQSKTYDGSVLTANNNATRSGNNLVSGHTATITCSGEIGPGVGSGTKTLESVIIKNGNTDVSSNYNITLVNGTLTISQAAITIPTPTGYTGTYDAASHTATFGAASGASITSYRWSTTNGSNWTTSTTNPGKVDAGTYYVQAYYTADGNHSGSGWSSSATIKINKRSVTITGGTATKVYDGTALTYTSATAPTLTGAVSGHHIHSYSASGTVTYVDEGTVNVVISNATIYSGTHNGTETNQSSNYTITYANGSLSITKANPNVTVTGVTQDYTGGQFYATAKSNIKGTLYWKRGSAPTVSSNDGSVSIDTVNENYNVTSVKDNSDDFTMYYLFVPSSAANSLSSGHTCAENYNNASGNKALTINPRNISNVSATATAVTYNGSSQTGTVTVTDSGATLTSSDYTISGNTGTDAGDYTVTITGQNNYTGTKTITWKINKRATTVTAGSDSKVYDGTALTKNSATASNLPSGQHLHSYTVTGSQTIAGSSNNVPSVAKIYKGTHSGTESDVTSNYTITYANGTLTVSARAITATAKSHSKTYDGTVLSATNEGSITSGSLPSGHTITYSCSGEVGPNVTSTGVATLNSVVIKNSGGTNVTSSFTVTKVNGTLKITNGTITYSTSASVSAYCTNEPMAIDVVDVAKTIEIASASATDATGSSTGITYSTNKSGWTNNGTTITVPANTAAGTYNITVSAAKSNHTTKTNSITVTIIETELTSLNLTLTANSVNYGSSTTVQSLIAGYNNGKTIDVKDDATTVYSQSPTGIVQFT